MTYTQVWDAMQNKASDSMIRRDEDQAHIPFDPDNVDYQAYLAWLAEGNAPKPPVAFTPPIEIPQPTIADVEEQVQDIETRLSALEGEQPKA